MPGVGVFVLFIVAVWMNQLSVSIALGAAALFLTLLAWIAWRRSTRWKQEAERYRILFDFIPVPVVLADSELRVIEGNDAAKNFLGTSRHARRSQNLLSIFAEAEPKTSDSLFRQIEDSGQAILNASAVGSTGKRSDVRVHLTRIEIAHQSRILALVEDTTDARKQSAQYESFIDHLIHNVPVEVTILSPGGHFHYLSSSFITEERHREWLLGKTDFDFCREYGLHVEVALRRRAHRLEAIDRKETVLFEEQLELNGKRQRLAWRYSPFIDAEGEVSMVLGFGVDISELSTYREELLIAQVEAQKAVRLKEALIQNVSHEIRTPLSSIIATAQMLQPDVPDIIRDFLENIEQSGHRLAETLNEMLDLAGLQSESLEIRPEILNLSAEMMELGRASRSAFERRGLFLRITANEPEILVRADHDALYRCIKSIVDNAAKFTAEGGVLVEVSSSVEFAYIRVIDTGVGIGEEIQDDVFEAFSQAESGMDRAFEGIGLGLTVTRRLLSLMDGDVRVHSRKGSGSSFVVRLPLLVPELRRLTGVKPRVMIADAHRETHRMMRHMLGDYFEFESAYSLADTADLFGRWAFEVVLVDGGFHSGSNTDELFMALQERAGTDVPLILMDHRRQTKRKQEIRS
ncbi:MAG: ATP-binding protein, partial [Rhodothermales bacterium]